ncbi:MAG: FtsX-like permease family protein, partial [Hespellia sp.]|nr:FtsX-like permease family protein [Hespellia sp.]
DAGKSTDSMGEGGTVKKTVIPKKYVVHASGVVAGDPESYNANYYNVYCDINILKEMLKKEFSGRVIPGQPSTKSGKPYKYFAYTSARIQADDMENVDEVSSVIRDLGYNVTTNAEYLNSMKSQFAMVQAVLGGIGAVSLLVAAIGIANTMMMSIYERTKEIGVLKVLGCSLKNIKQMFLLEAAFIGFIGGVVGNALSFLLSFIINMLTGGGNALGFDGNISYIPLWLVLVSMVFAVFVGMIAGYFPALRAMQLSPLAAIRNE